MASLYSPADLALGRKLKKNGIVNPLWTIKAAREAHLPLAYACALLEQESGGGHNVFGHDPTIFVGAGQVTKEKYKAYKTQRGRTHMQGVGPCQLTWYAYQDKADSLGGCWHPLHNMQVGFQLLADLIRRNGLHAGLAAYNGSGAAAQRYADSVSHFIAKWQAILNQK